MLNGLGVTTGIDIARIAAASRSIAQKLDNALPSRYLNACAAAEY